VKVDRHAAAIVDHTDRAVLVERDLYTAGEARERLVDAVVHHLLYEVVRTGGIGVHPRSSAYWFEPGKDL
jgi:hypothetical protein